jgi:hypothetical protein
MPIPMPERALVISCAYALRSIRATHHVIARSEATKQSILLSWRDGLLRFARNDGFGSARAD